MPAAVKNNRKHSLLTHSTNIKSAICLSGSHLNLTSRPAGMMSRSTSPGRSTSPIKNNKKQRPKSAVPTLKQTKGLKLQKSRPLSANQAPSSLKTGESSETSSPTYLPSDEISLWMSDEMLRAENKSAESASTSKMISPFSETPSLVDAAEKTNPKHLRFAEEEDFIFSVVEQLKEQVKCEIPEAEENGQSAVAGKNKPKSLIELLEIVDGEIPIEFRKKNFTTRQKPRQVERKKKEVKCKKEQEVVAVQDSSEDPAVKENENEDSENEMEEPQDNDAKTPQNDCLKTIFNFLDEEEKKEFQPSKINPLPALEETEIAPHMKGNKQIQILKEALEEKVAHVQLLKESLLQTRVESADALAAAGKEHRIMARKQKLEYESALKKLQDGMEKLLSDKKMLVEKVEELVQKLREAESKHVGAIQALQQRQTVEIARTKQIAAAAEKVRREKWVERQTARIKELTVKGLEPELTRLNLQHENKVAQIQASHSRELQAQVEAEGKRVDELRSAMLKEKDEELARERTLISERFERQIAEERAMMEIRCERLKEEANSEAARLQANWTSQKEMLIAQAWQEAQRVQALHDQQILLLEEKKQAEITAAKEELREEQAAWLTAQNRKNAELLAAKQQELKEQRDKEIERAIERLEAEERRSKAEQEKETEKKIQRLRDQQRAMLADRDLNEKLLQARLAEAQKGLEESEKQLLAAKANESRLKQELCISEQRVQALEGEHSRIRDIVEKQYAKQVADLEMKISEMKVNRDAELEQVHTRLKGVLEKKDQCIEQMKAQESDLAKRCKHLETLLGR
ncbi:centrosomal protein of 131 kDa [Cloeon dipterum]|uniref:centrosomal protein of 131 kDa n=1 Tax=Cloeon dipterum TaxID=197152 RepID=UPI0032204804